MSFFYLAIAIGIGIITAGTIGHLLQIKKKWWAYLGIFAAGWTISGMIIYIGDLMNLPPTLFFFLAAVWLCCDGSGLKKITIGFMISSTIFSWNSIVDNFIWHYYNVSYLFLRAIFAVTFFAGTKWFAPKEDYELDPSMWRLALLLTLLPIGSVCSVILLSDPYWVHGNNLSLHLVILCISLLSFIGLLWTVRILAKHKTLEQENMFARMNQKYYEMMERQHFEIRTLKHDLANHLQALSLLPENERNEYIKELLGKESVTKTLNYCGDPTINAVLSVKDYLIKQENISFHVSLDIPGELPFHKADICAIYANILDNAIEACQKIPAKERKITLKSRAGKGILAVKIKNSCVNTQKKLKEKTLPKTTKSNTKYHGFGLRSIEEIIKKYGGDMEIKREENWFEVFLYLPLI